MTQNFMQVPILWQYTIVNFQQSTYIEGTLLEKMPYLPVKKGLWSHLKHIRSVYFTSVVKERELLITTPQQEISVTTNSRGSFSFMIDKATSEVHIKDLVLNKVLQPVQSYPFNFKSATNSFQIISDIDDTILASKSASVIKRVGTLLFNSIAKRRTIEETKQWYQHLAAKGHKVYYVSKSEINLFHILTTIFSDLKVPIGPLFLMPYNSFNQVLFDKKSPSFKSDQISMILNNTSTKFILVGDDSQQDLKVYHTIATQFRDRILKIYIRKTKASLSTEKAQFKKAIESLGISVTLYDHKAAIDIEKEFTNIKSISS